MKIITIIYVYGKIVDSSLQQKVENQVEGDVYLITCYFVRPEAK